MPNQYRQLNRNVRRLVDRHLSSCVPGTRIDAKALARQLSDSDRIYLTGTIAHILHNRPGLRCESVTEYLVV